MNEQITELKNLIKTDGRKDGFNAHAEPESFKKPDHFCTGRSRADFRRSRRICRRNPPCSQGRRGKSPR